MGFNPFETKRKTSKKNARWGHKRGAKYRCIGNITLNRLIYSRETKDNQFC